MRNLIINKIHNLMRKNKKIFFLTADMGINLVEIFKKDFPNRFLNVGIAEQNLISISAGLANMGFFPVAYTISNFLVHRCFEQIRNDILLHNYPIMLIGTSTGFDNAPLGPTHHMVDDWGSLKSLPGIEIYSPCSNSFGLKKVEEIFKKPRACFFRLSKADFAQIKNSKNFTLLNNKNSKNKSLYVSYGSLGLELIKLNKEMKKDVLLLNKIYPLKDEKNLGKILQNYKNIIIVEDQFPYNGLYSVFCDIKNNFNLSSKIISLSPKNYDFYVGKNPEYYHKKYGLDFNSISKLKV